MSYAYETNCGQYLLTRDGKPIAPLMDEVGIAYSEQGSEQLMLHKHGSAQTVREWADKAREKLQAAGPLGVQMASEIHVVCGQLNLSDLNLAIEGVSSALKRLIRNHQAIDVDAVVIDAPSPARSTRLR